MSNYESSGCSSSQVSLWDLTSTPSHVLWNGCGHAATRHSSSSDSSTCFEFHKKIHKSEKVAYKTDFTHGKGILMIETSNSGKLLEKDRAGGKDAQAKHMFLSRFVL